MSDSARKLSDIGNGSGLTRRDLIKRAGLVASGAGLALLAESPVAVAAARRAVGSAPAAPLTFDQEAATPEAQPITIEEISRHPSDMPPSADYARYADGRFEGPTERGDAPMTHEVRFAIREGVAEVVRGSTMTYWTFDGTIPGPMIRARVGDSLDFFLRNEASNIFPHNVDFHAVNGPGGGAIHLDTLPGGESQLKVKLLNPGIYIYHCAFPDVPMHIAHGMYGLVVVEPEGGLPPVDREYYVMQSEFYTDRGATKGYLQLADQGHLAFSMDTANEERPTFVTFNGRPEAITGERALGVFDEPIVAGQTVRLFVGNIGPNLVSSFHVIGEIFDTVYVEGSFDLRNANVQSTVIPAGGAAGVEFRVDVPGTYLLVDHSIFRTHKGAAGVLVAGGEPVPEIYEPIRSDKVR